MNLEVRRWLARVWLIRLCCLHTLLCGCLTTGSSQGVFQLYVLPLDRDSAFLAAYPLERRYPDSVALRESLGEWLRQLHGEAFLEASVDSLDCRDSSCLALLHVGPRYNWAALYNGNVPSLYLDQSGYREQLYRQKPFAYDELRRVQENLLVVAANQGYPFAQVWLDSIRIDGAHISAGLFMERGRLVRFDTLSLEGDGAIARAYLNYYLGIRPGALYSQERVLRSRQRLRELPFVHAVDNPSVAFAGDRAVVNLHLERRNASRFDFLIGVLPNSNQTGRTLITGVFEGEFLNQIGRGERLYAKFQQLRPQTQELHLQVDYPYVFGLPAGADLRLELYKRDTSFLDLIFDFGLAYLLEGGNYLKVFWNRRASNLLSIDETRLSLQQRLPDNLGLRENAFGLEWRQQRLDYRFNPRRGWSALLRGGAGVKTILRDNRIEALELGYLYDSLSLRGFQYRLSAQLAAYWPLFDRSAFKLGASGAFIFSPQPVFQNEQYRIGGNRLLRGFDEEIIFATRYAVGTAEYRLLLGQNSFLYLFGDFAWVRDLTNLREETLFPYGFGTGITFETKVGLFGVSMALGTFAGTPVDFGRPKVHFGYVSMF